MITFLRKSLPQPFKQAVRAALGKAHLLRLLGDGQANPLAQLQAVHQRIGIGNYLTSAVSGEDFFTGKILPALVEKKNPVIFDVGANAGDYTLALLKVFSYGTIYSFEPSPITYATLVSKVPVDRVRCVPQALSNCSGTSLLFDYENQAGSQHASLHSGVLHTLHGASSLRQSEIKLTTFDAFCESEGIAFVDFLKIDTEGNEFAVLEGASKSIGNDTLPLIQFEFNEMNVISRVFLRDFYELLKEYQFYRIMPNGLLSLGPYNPRNEVFYFQNILAVRTGGHPMEAVQSFVVA